MNTLSEHSIDVKFEHLLEACKQFRDVCWLAEIGSERDGLVPTHFKGVKHVFAFSEEQRVGNTENDYRFGHFAYDLKNELENLSSKNPIRIKVGDKRFFTPDYLVMVLDSGAVSFKVGEEKKFYERLVQSSYKSPNRGGVNLVPALSKEQYQERVSKIKDHIQLGDVYELNFCMDHVAEDVVLDPVEVFQCLYQDSEAPFCAFYKCDSLYVIGLSPERFLAKRGDSIYAQPMKGTASRTDGNVNSELDQNPKERAENIMITDLMRNDLSRSAVKGSVKVEELCGVYPFGSVWQMISTVSCQLRRDVTAEQAILSAFPMGSMTGAPKVRAMELIEHFEDFKRGIYSGSIGYFAPNGDFDFNVVIRSLIYDSESKMLSCPTGSAITIKSDPEKEYEECMLKAAWIKEKLNTL